MNPTRSVPAGLAYIVSGMILVVLAYLLIVRPLTASKEPVSQTDATVIVNRIERVLKLVTVEGHFSEIMTYSDYQYLDLPGFRKKAVIQVEGRVLVGYDLEGLDIGADEKLKTIHIRRLPPPTILAVDHQLRYYDIDNGLFNSFEAKELSQLNAKARDLIVQKAEQTSLKQEAEAQRNELFSLLYFLAKDAGWKVVVSGQELSGNETLKD